MNAEIKIDKQLDFALNTLQTRCNNAVIVTPLEYIFLCCCFFLFRI